MTDVNKAASDAITEERVSEIYEEQDFDRPENADPSVTEESEEDAYEPTESPDIDAGIRYNALNMACATVGASADKAQILDAAVAFEAYLRGEEVVAPPQQYPYREGDVVVLGPEVFVGMQGRVINWRGQNYIIQRTPNTED